MKQKQGTAWLNGWIFLMNGMAGLMNVTTMLYFHTPTTHLTGYLSRFSIDVAQNNWHQLPLGMAILVCFVLGSSLSGYLFADRVFYLKRRYGIVLMLLGCGHLLLNLTHHVALIVGYCAFCGGVQNGLFIFYRGALVRTTHFTGYLTDIGFELGRVLKGQGDALWKVKFYLTSMLYFMIGGAMACAVKAYALMVIGLGYLLVGGYYFIFRNYFYHHK